jgi:hypothetical protein
MDEYKQIDIKAFDTVLAAFEKIGVSRGGESGAREEACKVAASLFPFFQDSSKDDQALSDYALEQYGYYRSLGMTISDSAYSMRISSKRMHDFLQGCDSTLEQFVALIQQELFSRAECKSRLLRDVEQSSGTKNWRTSLTLLEKLYPDEYGSRASLEDKIDKLVEHVWQINIVDPEVDETAT